MTNASVNAIKNNGTFTMSGGTINGAKDAVRNGTSSNRIGRLWVKGGTLVVQEVAIANYTSEKWSSAATSGVIFNDNGSCGVHITSNFT